MKVIISTYILLSILASCTSESSSKDAKGIHINPSDISTLLVIQNNFKIDTFCINESKIPFFYTQYIDLIKLCADYQSVEAEQRLNSILIEKKVKRGQCIGIVPFFLIKKTRTKFQKEMALV